MSETADERDALRRDVQALLERVRLLEDKIAIGELLTRYGPAIDAGDPEAVGKLWTEDAVYDTDVHVMKGRDQITKMVVTKPHQDYIAGGCAHVIDPPYIRVDGDTAVATCHTQLLRHDAESGNFYPWRTSASRFDLVKRDGRWWVQRRTTRLLDGRTEAPELLSRADA